MASLVLAGALSISIALVGYFFAPDIAGVFGLDPATLKMAADNIRWLSVFNVAFAVNFILGAALRASGDAWTPLWISGGVNLLNLPLLMFLSSANSAFRIWAWPVPPWLPVCLSPLARWY